MPATLTLTAAYFETLDAFAADEAEVRAALASAEYAAWSDGILDAATAPDQPTGFAPGAIDETVPW